MTLPPAAPAPQLRPLGVGDIVDRVFAIYRAKPLLLIAAATVPYLLFVLVLIGATIVFAAGVGFTELANLFLSAGSAVPDPQVIQRALVGLIGFTSFVIIAAVVILSVQTTALVLATARQYLGRAITLGQAFSEGLAAAPRVIFVGLLVFALFIAMWLLLAIVMIVSQEIWVVAVLTLVGMIATVYIFASTLVAPVVATLERVGPVGAVQRAFALSDGNRWRIIGLQILLVVINAVLGAIVSAIFVTPVISDTVVRTAAQQLVNALITILWAPVQWGTFTILYYDLRVRREAFDLQLAAEALPREA